jgi:hypothetical protein
MPRRVSLAPVVRVFLPRSSVSSTGQSSQELTSADCFPYAGRVNGRATASLYTAGPISGLEDLSGEAAPAAQPMASAAGSVK